MHTLIIAFFDFIDILKQSCLLVVPLNDCFTLDDFLLGVVIVKRVLLEPHTVQNTTDAVKGCQHDRYEKE